MPVLIVWLHSECFPWISFDHTPWPLPLAGSDARTMSGCAIGRIEVRGDTLSELLRLYLTEMAELEEVRGGAGGAGVELEKRGRG